MKYALVYGFAEGPWMGRYFHQAMQQNGHEQVKELKRADIIICHSAGSYLNVPSEINARILLIGPPYWPGKSLFTRLVRKVGLDVKASFKQQESWYWLQKTGWNGVYILLHPIRSWRLTRNAGRNNFYEYFNTLRVTVIRNDEDAWSTPEIAKTLQKLPNMSFIAIPGQHDDCWRNPEPYISLLQSTMR